MQFANFIRLSCGMPWSPKIEQAISVLGGLVRQLARYR
jgi:DNA-binding transcriptional MocR family regulator